MNWALLRQRLSGMKKSFTIWFNSVVGTAVVGIPQLQDSLPQIQTYIPENFFKILAVTLIIGNILLRIKTNRGLENK